MSNAEKFAKALRSEYPLAKSIILGVTTVGTFAAVTNAIGEYSSKLVADGFEERGLELTMIALDMVEQARNNGWDCGEPDCEDCRTAREMEGDGLKRSRVFEIPPYDAGEA